MFSKMEVSFFTGQYTERKTDRQARRDTVKALQVQELRREKKHWCRGSLCSSLSHCKFPHLKNGEIHFSHRWEQARLISLKYPICWREREGEGGREKGGEKRQTSVNQTKQFSCPRIICFPSNDVCGVCVCGCVCVCICVFLW